MLNKFASTTRRADEQPTKIGLSGIDFATRTNETDEIKSYRPGPTKPATVDLSGLDSARRTSEADENRSVKTRTNEADEIWSYRPYLAWA